MMVKSGKLNVNKSNTLHGIPFEAITLIGLGLAAGNCGGGKVGGHGGNHSLWN